MNSSASTRSNFVTPPWELPIQNKNLPQNTNIQKQTTNIPKSFIWTFGDVDIIDQPKEVMDAPIIDLEGFLRGDEMAKNRAIELVKVACSSHGFFHVINHGVESKLIKKAYDNTGHFFKLPPTKKANTLKKPGYPWGLSMAHTDRWTTNLPWKETLSFPHHAKNNDNVVEEFFTSVLGNEFQSMGMDYQKYCEEMHKLTLVVTELLAVSLGVERSYYREFFEDAKSIMRLNYYPPCDEPNLVLGTGPHCDPTSITVLYQDDAVEGLQVFVDNKWKIIEPHQHAFVINIGDTFMAMTNGEYKSCLHRAVVNSKVARTSMAFFLCPQEDKVVRPPDALNNKPRKYPDFTWLQFFSFTQKNYRADHNTLQGFTDYLWSKLPPSSNDSSPNTTDE